MSKKREDQIRFHETLGNPHIANMLKTERDHGLERDWAGIESAKRKPKIVCKACGCDAYFKPTVGAYVCIGQDRHVGKKATG